MKWNVLISCHHLQNTIDHYRQLFKENDIEIDMPSSVQQLNETDLMEIIHKYDGVIAGDDQFTEKVLEKAKKLKILAKWGVGIDAIDLDAAKRLGIKVANTPQAFGNEVADVTMGYIILLARQLHRMDASVRSGGWLKVQGISLSGKKLGIIGMGNIGQSLAQRAAAHGMKILPYDVVPIKSDVLQQYNTRQTELVDLLKNSDFISLCCNLTATNRFMVSTKEFNQMKRGVFIVNTARGPLIDELALIEAIRSGIAAAAALDVFEEEPLPADSPLRKFDNCIFGTHNSSNTKEAVMRVNELAIKNLLEGLKGASV